jgi:hypothetical protein
MAKTTKKNTEPVIMVLPDADEMQAAFSKLKTPSDIQKSIANMVADATTIAGEETNKHLKKFQEAHLNTIKHYANETKVLDKNFTPEYMQITWQKAYTAFHKLENAHSINHINS